MSLGIGGVSKVGPVANLTTLLEYTGNNLIYIGRAAPGTASSAAKWQIKKLTYSGNNLTATGYASGDDAFIYVWDDRAGYSYS